ncbi:MAG: signal peptide peptidase SppA [Rhodoblastus sp.]|nr:signal peptide peptidase SppA [Rhodoblastus sp.]
MVLPSPEYLVERRLLTRKLSFWRIAALGALAVAVLVAGWRLAGDRSHAGAHIARVRITGVIKDDRDLLKVVRDVAASSASAAILSIDSPGGTTTGAEALYDELRQLAAKKPTVAVVDGMAASGAYIAAIAADGVVARGNSMVGSIGVLMQMPNAAKLMEIVGVKMEEIKSAPLKAAPNPYEPITPEARAAVAAMIADSYNWFKGLVKERRKLDDASLAIVSDGRVFTGRQGIELKLVDRIGGEREAIAWLEAEKGVAKGLKVRDWKKPRKIQTFGLLGALADSAGLDRIAAALTAADGFAQARLLDGLLAIWQGSALN